MTDIAVLFAKVVGEWRQCRTLTIQHDMEETRAHITKSKELVCRSQMLCDSNHLTSWKR